MKKAEDTIFEDEGTGVPSDESSILSNADEDQSQDLNLDELYSLLGESSSSDSHQAETEAFTEVEAALVEPMSSDISVLDELQSMYSDLDSSSDENDSVSVMDELEAMYGDSAGSVINNDESDADSVSIMEELEAMYGSFSESASDDENSSKNNHEPVTESVSVLAELEALLADTGEAGIETPLAAAASDSHEEAIGEETGFSETSSSSDYEHLFENRRSVLDELQNLLQSSIEELEASADNNTGASMSVLGVEYPSRNELKTLLEDKLSQLMMVSDGSGSFDFDEGQSVLDELNALMEATGSGTSASNLYLSANKPDDSVDDKDVSASDEIDEYISSITPTSENIASDDGASSVLDELESMLSGTAEAIDSEMVPDDLSISTDAANGNDDSVLSESAAYLDELSEFMKVESIDSMQAPGVGTVSVESGGASDVLEQLEEMLAETVEQKNDEISENRIDIDNDNDFALQQESTDLPGKSKDDTLEEIKLEEVPELKEKIQPVEADQNRLKQKSISEEIYSLEESESNKGLPLWLGLIAVVVVGVLVLWNFSGSGEEQAKLAESVTPAETGALLVKTSTPDEPAEIESISDLLARLEATRYEQKSSYDYETYEQPVQPDVDEPLSDEGSDSSVDMDVSQLEQQAQSIVPVIPELTLEAILNEPSGGDLTAKAGNIWSVHLMAYYNEPPHASELKFLADEGIPYKIEKVKVNDGDWYRVLVKKSSEYNLAKEYAEMLANRLGIKDIWISKTQRAED